MTSKDSTTKLCTDCEETKSVAKFNRHKKNKDGLQYACKICQNRQIKQYHRTRKGLVSLIYGNMKLSSKRRGNNPPEFTKDELESWVFSQQNFGLLYNNWANSNYCRMLSPSCDRLDDYKGYAIGRLRLITWKENNDKYYADTKDGINNKANKRVIQQSRQNEIINIFHSMSSASMATGINQGSISRVCLNKSITAGGFKWTFG